MGNTLKVLPWLYRFKTKSHDKIPIYRRNTRNIQQVEIETGYFINASEWNARSYKIRSTELQARKINEHPATTKFKIPKNYTQPQKIKSGFCCQE